MGKEQEMVNQVKKYYESIVISNESSERVGGSTNKCDIALKMENIKYYLEAKCYNINNEANYPKQIFGECLYNRKFHKREGNYGILVDYDDEKKSKILETIKEYICEEDWEKYGEAFSCARIFMYDNIGHKLYYIPWKKLYDPLFKPLEIQPILRSDSQ